MLATLGKREGNPADLDEREKPIVRRQAIRVVWQSIAIALIAAIAIALL